MTIRAIPRAKRLPRAPNASIFIPFLRQPRARPGALGRERGFPPGFPS
ncbi:hypothetical protein COLSTE_00583 [Collinsella stercoris DSM 13279]|uniref:Uncharacterized protein n=1 Tax=Collinsella stercoris DSM 13279 TaxID=445975 RepID=B6G942_9ACTN|nr:hypothetical protein COLSTE_00583 [Collinsella stercoris DSM 13279]